MDSSESGEDGTKTGCSLCCGGTPTIGYVRAQKRARELPALRRFLDPQRAPAASPMCPNTPAPSASFLASISPVVMGLENDGLPCRHLRPSTMPTGRAVRPSDASDALASVRIPGEESSRLCFSAQLIIGESLTTNGARERAFRRLTRAESWGIIRLSSLRRSILCTRTEKNARTVRYGESPRSSETSLD